MFLLITTPLIPLPGNASSWPATLCKSLVTSRIQTQDLSLLSVTLIASPSLHLDSVRSSAKLVNVVCNSLALRTVYLVFWLNTPCWIILGIVT